MRTVSKENNAIKLQRKRNFFDKYARKTSSQ